MAHQQDSLLQRVLEMLGSSEVADIIEQADEDTSMSARERKETLVESGIALGVEKTRLHAIKILSGQVDLLQNTLKAIDDRMVDAMDTDGGTEFLYKLREGIAHAIKGHVRLIAERRAAEFHRKLGVPVSTYLARDMSPEGMASLTRAPAFANPPAFFGFIMIENPDKLECVCPTCLEREGFPLIKSPNETLQKAVTRFGSVEEAARAFTEFVLRTEWKVIDEIEASFGNVDSADSERVGEFTTNTLARLFNGDSHRE